MENIPKVVPPMDFGIEYLSSTSHGNLRFLLDGEELTANSAIMSFNSPAIKKMTIDEGLTAISVEEFSKGAVHCFLEASYSGKLGKIRRNNFRQVNKLVHKFEVDWLIERCFKYFQSLTEAVKEDDFEDQLYVFEEAMHVMEKLKKRNFVDDVIRKFTSKGRCTQYFVKNYLKDLGSCLFESLGVILEMTSNEAHVLAEIVINDLESNILCLNQNSRRILENLNFSACPPSHLPVYQKLLEKLENIENPSTDDYRLTFKILKQLNTALHVSKQAMSFVELPNLFHKFQHLKDIPDLDGLLTYLSKSPIISNSYIFCDAVYSWMVEKQQSNGAPFAPIPDTFIEQFANHMSERRWKPLATEYIKHNIFRNLGGFTDKILKNPKMITQNFNRIPATLDYYAMELFSKNHDIKFRFKAPGSVQNCSQDGNCGFILRVTTATNAQDVSNFNIQLITDPSLYPEDIHFHTESVLTNKNIHLAIDITTPENVKKYARPVTWYGKPRFVRSRFWVWGAHCFVTKDEWNAANLPATGVTSPKDANAVIGRHGANAKIRPVIFYFGDN